nr:MAG TPA: hypothetical protein [Bacteriophage sp.]
MRRIFQEHRTPFSQLLHQEQERQHLESLPVLIFHGMKGLKL